MSLIYQSCLKTCKDLRAVVVVEEYVIHDNFVYGRS